MWLDLFFLALFILVLFYVYANQNYQVMSTASAIQQIMTGGCRLGCRPNQFSGTNNVTGLQRGNQAQHGPAGPSRCICDTCPCEMIENVLETCGPVTQLYTHVTATFSQLYSNFITSISEAYEQATTIQSGVSYPPQIVGTSNNGSTENFSFGHTDALKKENTDEISKRKIDLNATKSPSVYINELPQSKANDSENDNDSKVMIEKVKLRESTDNVAGNKKNEGCPKCVKEGKTCIPECPHAKK